MKLGRVTMTNTDKLLIEMLGSADWVRAEALARHVYPKSKQIEKKAATYTRRLRRLQRFGMVREIQGAWALTRKGSQ